MAEETWGMVSISEKFAIEERIESYMIPHRHEFIEIVYIREGSGYHTVNNQRYHVTPGDMLFINYNQTHITEADTSFRLINIMFTPEFISNHLLSTENIFDAFAFILSDEFGDDFKSFAPIAHFRGKEYMEIEQIVSAMLSEYLKKEKYYRAIAKGYLEIIFGMLTRNIHKQALESPAQNLHKLTPELMHYIDINCFEKLNLKILAEQCFYTPSYLSRLFKETCGKSLTEYIKERRISEAMRLLAETNYSIAEISDLVGYSDRKLFNKFFKQYASCTPSEYRQKFIK